MQTCENYLISRDTLDKKTPTDGTDLNSPAHSVSLVHIISHWQPWWPI